MSSKEQLMQINTEVADRLERGLAARDKVDKMPAELQLARTQCAMATLSLQAMLREDYGIRTERFLGTPTHLPPKLGSRRIEHAILREPESGTIIDPTYKQFFGLIGLDVKRAHTQPELRNLYPKQSIALLRDESDVNDILAHAFAVRSSLGNDTVSADDTLRLQMGTIWNLDQYSPQEYDDFVEQYPNSVDMADLAIKEVLRTR